MSECLKMVVSRLLRNHFNQFTVHAETQRVQYWVHFTSSGKLTISHIITTICRSESYWAMFASTCVLHTSISIVLAAWPQILQVGVRLFLNRSRTQYDLVFIINYLSNILMIRVPGVIKGLALARRLLLAKTAHSTLMCCSNKCIYLEHIPLPWL